MDLRSPKPLRLPADLHEPEFADPGITHRHHQIRELHSLFKPILLIMGCFGLYHPSKKMVSETVHPDFRSNITTRWIFIGLGVANFFYLFSNFILLLVAHPKVDMALLTVNIWIIVLVWLAFAGLLNCAHFLVWEQERVDAIWELWANWAEKHPQTERKWVKMTNYRNVYLALACIVSVIPPVAIGAGMATAQAGSLIEGLLIPVEYGSLTANHIVLTINYTCISLLIYGTAAFATAFFVTNCLLISEELKYLYYTTAKHLEDGRIWENVKEDGEEVSVLEQLRRRRLEVRTIVEKLNQAFDKTAFLGLFLNVPLIVFIAYALIMHYRESMFTLAIGLIAILVSMMHVGVTTISAAWICEWANAPKDLLHTIKIHKSLEMSRVNHASLTLFLSELTSDKIGITAWQLALISKEFIATVFGLTVTYIIVLVEFGHQTEVLTVTHEITEQLTNMTATTTAAWEP